MNRTDKLNGNNTIDNDSTGIIEHKNNDMQMRKAALIAGIGWLLIIVIGIMAEFIIRMSLIDDIDPTTTVLNIRADLTLFRLSILLDLTMITLDIIVGWAIYRLLRSTNRSFALLMFRFAQAVIIAINTLNLVIVALLVSEDSYLAGLAGEQIESLVMLFLTAHGHGYDIALVFFGLHLIMLGYMIVKSEFLPGLPGWLLLIASVGYIIDSLANLILSAGSELISLTATVLILVAVIAEVTISIYLIAKRGSFPERS